MMLILPKLSTPKWEICLLHPGRVHLTHSSLELDFLFKDILHVLWVTHGCLFIDAGYSSETITNDTSIFSIFYTILFDLV